MFSCSLIKKTSDEVSRRIADKKNRKMEKAFAATPFEERMVFVPHCMRNIEKCKAKELGSYYICARCGACAIGPIDKKAAELGYMGVFVLKGGKTIEKLIAEHKPKAIVGVACYFEGAQGLALGEKGGVAVQFVPLDKDGCADTTVNLEAVYRVLELKA